MKRIMLGLFSTAATLAVACSASAGTVVLDFEDLSGFSPMPAGYGGIADWGSFCNNDAVDPNYPASSGDVYLISVGAPAPIIFGTDYIFDGAFFGGNNLPWAVKFELYDDGGLVHTSGSMYPALTPVFLDSGYDGPVDEVRIVSELGNFYSMDDFTYTTIPTPGSLALLGLVGLTTMRRRRTT